MGNSNCFQSSTSDDDSLVEEEHRRLAAEHVAARRAEPANASPVSTTQARTAPAVGTQPGHDQTGQPPARQSEEERIKLAQRLGFIYQIPTGAFDGSKKARECAICMVDFETGDQLRYLPCMHAYHQSCIDDWLLRSFTCPSCMQPVDAALLATFSCPDD